MNVWQNTPESSIPKFPKAYIRAYRLIRKAIAAMDDERQQNVLNWCYLDQLTPVEICEKLDRSRSQYFQIKKDAVGKFASEFDRLYKKERGLNDGVDWKAKGEVGEQ